MRLYYSPASPFVRKVMVVLHETGQLGDVDVTPVHGSAVDPGNMPVAQNPLGKLPTLERADGPALYDSRVICRYLDDRAGARLYPPKPRLWDTLTLEATGDGIMEAALLMVYEKRLRPEALWHAPWIEGQWSKAVRGVERLEAMWLSHLEGRPDMGHIAVGCALGYLDFRLGDRDWRGQAPGLAAWFARFAERPSMVATAPPEA